jgi:hypothetical protein
MMTIHLNLKIFHKKCLIESSCGFGINILSKEALKRFGYHTREDAR